MNVTIITKDAAELTLSALSAGRGTASGAARAARSACTVPALVGEPSTSCGDFFTYLAM
jgi:hypothetical protein